MSTLLTLVAEPPGANCTYGGTRADAGLDADRNGTLSSAEISSTSYLCRSSGGWISTATALQTASNTNYIATSDSAQVVLTLPAAPAVGDVITTTGAGSAGWKLAQNAGQSILTRGLPGSLATGGFGQVLAAPFGGWFSVASATDGRTVYATNATLLYRSADEGLSWTQVGPAPLASGTNVSVVATSGDGQKVVVAGRGYGVYVSQDGGQTWAGPAAGLPTTNNWLTVSVSASGTHMAASSNSGAGNIYISTDSGATWAAAPGVSNINGWAGVALSADGSRMVAAPYSGQIWASSDGGASWAVLGASLNTSWTALTMSSDGVRVAAAQFNGPIQVSGDSGASWTARATTQNWWSMASSANGSILIASTQQGALYSSTDQGTTWAVAPAGWSSASLPLVAVSGDGSRLYAVAQGGGVTRAAAHQSALGSIGSLAGGAGDSVTLQYIGSGRFIVLAHTSNTGSFSIR